MKAHFKIPEGILHEVAARLNEVAGIDAGSLDSSRIGWTIESRRRRLSMRDIDAYAAYLRSSSDELEHVIDALVIQETRFFRDHGVFEQIRIWAEGIAGGDGPLRVLSAPCSTGQEAYSLAAVLQSAGVALSRLTIDAFDISHTALAFAQRAVYPSGALEHVPDDLRQLCAGLQGEHWHIREDVRSRIRFERRNLAMPGALGDEPVYDLALCRNLFIYLHANARAVLAESLSRVLCPDGRLIIGTGDRVPELNSRFSALKPAAGFAFIHKTAAAASHRPDRRELPTAARVRRMADWAPAPEPERDPSTAVDFYMRAMEYHECGNLRQAERRCRQALYLDPGYLPALELLHALWQVHPSGRLRRALQARIHRIRGGQADGVSKKELA
jgi:chemotaxis protein methyltransferase WspC